MRDFNYDTTSLLNIEKPEALLLDSGNLKWLRAGSIETKGNIPSVAWSLGKSIGNEVFVPVGATLTKYTFNFLGGIDSTVVIPVSSTPNVFDVKLENGICKIIYKHSSGKIQYVSFDGTNTTESTLIASPGSCSYLNWGKTRDGVDCIYSASTLVVKAYTTLGALISSMSANENISGIKYWEDFIMILTVDYYYKYAIPNLNPATGDFSEEDYSEGQKGDEAFHFGPNGLLGTDGTDIFYSPYPSTGGSMCSYPPSGFTALRTGLISGTLMAGSNGDWSVVGQDNVLVDDSPVHSYNVVVNSSDGIY